MKIHVVVILVERVVRRVLSQSSEDGRERKVALRVTLGVVLELVKQEGHHSPVKLPHHLDKHLTKTGKGAIHPRQQSVVDGLAVEMVVLASSCEQRKPPFRCVPDDRRQYVGAGWTKKDVYLARDVVIEHGKWSICGRTLGVVVVYDHVELCLGNGHQDGWKHLFQCVGKAVIVGRQHEKVRSPWRQLAKTVHADSVGSAGDLSTRRAHDCSERECHGREDGQPWRCHLMPWFGTSSRLVGAAPTVAVCPLLASARVLVGPRDGALPQLR